MLVTLLLCAAPFQEARLQPATYASASGRRELVVEPDVLSGAKEATYRMRLDGVELWSVKRPLLLRDAVLAEDGRAAGWARSIDEGGMSGTLFAVVLSPEGEVLARQPYALTHEYGAHGGDLYFPRVDDVVLQPELGRFVLWAFAPDEKDVCGDELWSHDLATGARVARWRAPEAREDEHVELLAVRALPATPLLLVASQHVDYTRVPTRRDARFQLLDADGRSVWSLDFAHDHELGGEWTAELRQKSELREDPPILGVLPGRFELRAVAAAQRVLFAVESVDDAWRVRELSRVPYAPPGGAPASFRPSLLARVPLRSALPADEATGLASLAPAQGRILLKDEHARVHVFDLEGRELAVCALGTEEPSDWDDPRFSAQQSLGLTHDGRVDAGFGARHVRFAADGTSAGALALDAEGVVLRPEAAGAWGVQGNALVRLDAEGKVELRHDKRPDGRWYEGLRALAVAADGSLAALEGRRPPRAGSGALEKASLSLYDANGAPVRVLALAGEVPSASLSYQSGRVLLANDSAALLLELVSGRRFALELDEHARHEWNALALSPDGRELWVVRRAARELVRYALPE